MDFNKAKTILEIAYVSKIIPIISGNRGIGKTSIALEVFPDAVVIPNSEIELSSLATLRKAAQNSKVVIIENINTKVFSIISDILKQGWLEASKSSAFFVLTTNQAMDILDGFISIKLSSPSNEEWLSWAEKRNIHKKVIELVKEDNLLKIISPQKAEHLSRVLNAGVPTELLQEIVLPLVNNEQKILEKIKSVYTQEFNFDEVVTLKDQAFIDKLKQTNSKNIEDFNEKLVKEIIFDNSIMPKEKLIKYITSIDGAKSLEVLFGLLESKSNYDYLEELLKDKRIRKKIDSFV